MSTVEPSGPSDWAMLRRHAENREARIRELEDLLIEVRDGPLPHAIRFKIDSKLGNRSADPRVHTFNPDSPEKP